MQNLIFCPKNITCRIPSHPKNVQNPISSQNVLQATVTGFRFSPTARRPETPGFGGTGPDGSIFPPRLVIAIYIFYQYVCEMSYSELFNPCPTLLLTTSGAIITAWLLWSLRLEPFVATLDPGKGAELTFPRREQGEEWLKPPTVLRAQISHQRRNCTLLLFFFGASLSL